MVTVRRGLIADVQRGDVQQLDLASAQQKQQQQTKILIGEAEVEQEREDDELISLHTYLLTPGFIDLHTHGVGEY